MRLLSLELLLNKQSYIPKDETSMRIRSFKVLTAARLFLLSKCILTDYSLVTIFIDMFSVFSLYIFIQMCTYARYLFRMSMFCLPRESIKRPGV